MRLGEHSQEWLYQRYYFPTFFRSFGVESQTSSPLGGTRRLNSTMATPAFFSEVM